MKGPVSPIPTWSKHLKQPLAILKELCDKQRLKYEVRVNESKVAENHFQFTGRILVKNKDSLETQLEAEGKPKQTKKEAKHSAAAEAIARLGK